MQMLLSDWLSYMYQSLVHNGWKQRVVRKAYSKQRATNMQTNSSGITNQMYHLGWKSQAHILILNQL